MPSAALALVLDLVELRHGEEEADQEDGLGGVAGELRAEGDGVLAPALLDRLLADQGL